MGSKKPSFGWNLSKILMEVGGSLASRMQTLKPLGREKAQHLKQHGPLWLCFKPVNQTP